MRSSYIIKRKDRIEIDLAGRFERIFIPLFGFVPAEMVPLAKSKVVDNMGRPCHVKIEIPVKDKQSLDILFKAEELLRQIGIEFDSGMDLESHVREWEFDSSLGGARVTFYEFADEKKE